MLGSFYKVHVLDVVFCACIRQFVCLIIAKDVLLRGVPCLDRFLLVSFLVRLIEVARDPPCAELILRSRIDKLKDLPP